MGRDARLMELLELTKMTHLRQLEAAATEAAALAQAAAEAAAREEAAQAETRSGAVTLMLNADPAALSGDAVVCACCEQSFVSLKRHLLADHGMDEATYRGRYGIALDVPLVAASYLARKAACVSAYRGKVPAR